MGGGDSRWGGEAVLYFFREAGGTLGFVHSFEGQGQPLSAVGLAGCAPGSRPCTLPGAACSGDGEPPAEEHGDKALLLHLKNMDAP